VATLYHNQLQKNLFSLVLTKIIIKKNKKTIWDLKKKFNKVYGRCDTRQNDTNPNNENATLSTTTFGITKKSPQWQNDMVSVVYVERYNEAIKTECHNAKCRTMLIVVASP
jgi:hypothetical protein